jgi:O-antigen ligase
VTGFAVAMVLIAVYFANFGALAARFASVLEQGTNRVEIWRQTLAIVRDFPLTGTGLGTYSTAMLVYQQGDRSFFFNQAHNHYLQVAAEGGLLVGIPVVAAAIALLTLTRRRLADDRSPVFWARAGAVAALVAVAVQSVWETGLRMPANGVLLAVVAALAVHAPRQHRTPTES